MVVKHQRPQSTNLRRV